MTTGDAVETVRLPVITDARGSLSFGEIGRHLAFAPQRYFTIFDVPRGAVRGVHAHRQLHEFHVCLHGAYTLELDDGLTQRQVRLDSPALGVYVRPRIWRTMRDFAPGTIVLVLASHPFDLDDYIRDHAEFLKIVREHQDR